jgi:hypothetical protein
MRFVMLDLEKLKRERQRKERKKEGSRFSSYEILTMGKERVPVTTDSKAVPSSCGADTARRLRCMQLP